MNLRKLAFILLDKKNGSPVENAMQDLATQFNSSFNDADTRKENIAQHVTTTVPYYKQLKGSKISEFPIIQKNTIKDNTDNFISETYKSTLTNLRKVTTSGSYGTPFTFYLNRDKRNRMIAEVYFFGKSSGLDIGKKHAYAVAKKKSRFEQFKQNQLMLTVGTLDDKWCMEAILTLQRAKIKVLIGYASTIDRLAIYLINQNKKIKMDGVITISEVLTNEARNRINNAFLCYPVSRYSTEEFGVLANQDISGDYFYLNQSNYFIEVLNIHCDRPAEIGELGRIVVTDYFNLSMPLIRYDIGDLATPVEIKNGHVTKIDRVEGRQLEVIKNTSGEVISSFKINGALRDSKDIIQFQFSQENISEYKLKVIAKDSLNKKEIIRIYQEILGQEAIIKLEFVENIPPLPSGKRPYIIQNFYKS